MTEERSFRALYQPSTGMVGCVIIQAVFGGDREVCHLFSGKDWYTAPVKDAVWIDAPMKDWEFVASLSREERLKLGVNHGQGDEG